MTPSKEVLCKIPLLFNYDPRTGDLTRLITTSNSAKEGGVAGSPSKSGHLRVCIQGKSYYAHHVAWYLYYGEWPVEIDHIDWNRANNAIGNLREVTRAQNMANRRPRGPRLMGVVKVGSRYRAQISINKKTFYVGTFDTEEEAHLAYLEVKEVIHGPVRNGGHRG